MNWSAVETVAAIVWAMAAVEPNGHEGVNWPAVEAIATVAAVVVAAGGVLVAWWQLSNLNATFRMNTLAVVLQLEAEMNNRKRQVDDVACELQKEAAKTNKKQQTIDALNGKLNASLESWFNAVDRFAFCIRKKYLPESDWKSEYREMFLELVRVHADWFGNDSCYTNIIDLAKKWRRE